MSSVTRCDFNMYNIRYAVALAKQHGIKRGAESEEERMESEEEEEEESEEASDAADLILVA